MTITQTVEIPADRRLSLELEIPREVTADIAHITIQFPVQKEVKPVSSTEQDVASEGSPLEKPIAKDNNGKICLTKEMIEDMLQKSPHTRTLSGILSGMGDVDLDVIRMERLAKHL